MSDRYAIQVRWVFRERRYVARCKRFPTVIAYGASMSEAQEAMAAAIGRHVSSNEFKGN